MSNSPSHREENDENALKIPSNKLNTPSETTELIRDYCQKLEELLN